MIYIFDDRSERKAKYSKSFNRYSRFVTFKNLECNTSEELLDFICELQNPSLVLLHSSYRYPGGKLYGDEVISHFSSLDIPIIIFSGSFVHPGESIIQDKYKIYSVNSIEMYQNLQIYLGLYERDKSVSFDVILWGETYLQNKIYRTLCSIYRNLCEIDPEETINDDHIEVIKANIEDYLDGEELKDVRNNLFKIITPNKTWNALIDDINNTITKL